MSCMSILLSERQRDILRLVVEEYVATGQPVGSKTLVERAGLGVSPSTVRYELAELEREQTGGAAPQSRRSLLDRLVRRR